MIANAKQYNERNSQVFFDAEKIRKMVSVYMEDRNPAYRIPGYQPVPTPIPENWRERQAQGAMSDHDEEEPAVRNAPSEPISTRKSGRNAANSPAVSKRDRKTSSTPARNEGTAIDGSFGGKNFQQAQEQIVTQMLELEDEE